MLFGRGKNRTFLFRFQQADFVGGHAQIVTQIAPVHFANGYEIADGTMAAPNQAIGLAQQTPR